MATGFTVLDIVHAGSRAGQENEKAKFRTKDISIHKMYPNEHNFYSIEDIQKLACDISLCGLRQNLEVVHSPCDKGEYKIIAGERRWRALKYLVEDLGCKDFEYATCKISAANKTEEEEQIGIIVANAYRDKTINDQIEEERRLKECIERMRAAGQKLNGYDLSSGRTREIVATILGMSNTKIAQLEKVGKDLIPEFKEEMDKGSLKFTAAYQLSQMCTEDQRLALEKYIDTGELTVKDIKQFQEQRQQEKEAAQIEGQITIPAATTGEEAETEEWEKVSDSDTEDHKRDPGEEEDQKAAGDNREYIDPEPKKVQSLCYSCQHYNDCDVKSSTVNNCNAYTNKAEAEKTEEQRYSEEQDHIDRETKRLLHQQEDEAKINRLPSQEGTDKKYFRLPADMFQRLANGLQRYLILKTTDCKVGDRITVGEIADGRATGNTIDLYITYMDDSDTATALNEGYCIISVADIAATER